MKKKKAVQFEKASEGSTLAYRLIPLTILFISTIILLKNLFTNNRYGVGWQALLFAGIIGIMGYISWESFSTVKTNKRLFTLGAVGWVLVVGIYVLAFDPILGSGGDNAHYINLAKSLSQFQGYRDPMIPGSPPALARPPAFPFLLAPVVRLFGINIVALKMVPFLMGVIALLFVFLFFRTYLPLPRALLIALLTGTNYAIVEYTSEVLTEIPFLCLSLLALLLLLKFEKEKTTLNIYCLLAGFLVVVTYWTRWGALTLLGTSVLYFILKNNYKKALALGAVILVFFLYWQIRCMVVKSTDVSGFDLMGSWISDSGKQSLVAGILSKGFTNLKIAFDMIPQNLFNYKLMSGKVLTTNLWIVIVSCFVLLGYVWHLVRFRTQMDLYVPTVMIAPILTSIPSPANIARYLVPLVPFLIYYLFVGIGLFFRRFERLGTYSKHISNTVLMIVASLMLFVNLSGISDKIQLAHRKEPYPADYARFLETAFWAKKETPPGSYFAVRKPTTFYLLSERCACTYYGNVYGPYDQWSKDAEEKILSMYEENNIDFLILDRFSGSAYYLIYPIIKNNPDKFKVVFVTEEPKTYVFQINKWWRE